jgi:hypothetical protein
VARDGSGCTPSSSSRHRIEIGPLSAPSSSRSLRAVTIASSIHGAVNDGDVFGARDRGKNPSTPSAVNRLRYL